MQSIAISCWTSSFHICYNYELNFWLDISQKEMSEWTLWDYQRILPSKNLSQLREYIEKHPSETERLLGMDYDQLIELITHAENLYNHPKKLEWIHKTRLIKAKAGSDLQPKLAIADQLLLTKRILASLADISKSRRTIWSQRINR